MAAGELLRHMSDAERVEMALADLGNKKADAA
jgi:hypothetical protein